MDQKRLCYYCQHSLDHAPPESIKSKPIEWRAFPPNFLHWPIHLHHSHEDGWTLGAVHAYCNAVLWEYENQ